jgi:hypothetical protein
LSAKTHADALTAIVATIPEAILAAELTRRAEAERRLAVAGWRRAEVFSGRDGEKDQRHKRRGLGPGARSGDRSDGARQ